MHTQQRRAHRKKQEYPIFRRDDPNFHIPSGTHTHPLHVCVCMFVHCMSVCVYEFILPAGIMHMAVSNGYVTIVMVGNIIYRFSMQNPRAVDRKRKKVKGECS